MVAGDRGPSSVEEPRWPLVLGWVCVFYAVYSLLELLYALFPYSVMWVGRRTWPSVWLLVLWLVQQATVIGALAGGWLIQRRNRSARCVICIYAAATLLLYLAVGIGTAFAVGALINPYRVAAGALGMASSVALPAFVLVWFARPAVREQIAGWRTRGNSLRPAAGPSWPWIVAAASLATAYVDLSVGIQRVVGLIHLVGWLAQAYGGGLMGALGRVHKPSLVLMIALPLAPLLVAGAVLLLKRRRIAIWVHLIWAGMTLLLALPYVESTYSAVVRILSGLYPPLQPSEVDALWRMGRLALYPPFLLIWFLRPRIRRELRGWAAKRTP